MGDRCAAVLATVMMAALWAVGTPVAAAPLDAEECGRLAEEHKVLVGAGIEAQLEKGPDWARDNLDEAQLDRIKQFLAIEEQLQFRCPLIRHVKAATPKKGPGIPLPLRNPDRVAKAPSSASVQPAAPVKPN